MEKGMPTLYRESRSVVDIDCARLDEPASASVVVDALAAAVNRDPREVPPLYEYIDPDLLDNLFDQHDGATGTVLGFQVENCNVFVRTDGRILVCDATDPLPEPEPVFESS